MTSTTFLPQLVAPTIIHNFLSNCPQDDERMLAKVAFLWFSFSIADRCFIALPINCERQANNSAWHLVFWTGSLLVKMTMRIKLKVCLQVYIHTVYFYRLAKATSCCNEVTSNILIPNISLMHKRISYHIYLKTIWSKEETWSRLSMGQWHRWQLTGECINTYIYIHICYMMNTWSYNTCYLSCAAQF